MGKRRKRVCVKIWPSPSFRPSFDANGNQTVERTPASGRTTTVWNYENQPTLYKLASGARVTMAYNADNQRISKDT